LHKGVSVVLPSSIAATTMVGWVVRVKGGVRSLLSVKIMSVAAVEVQEFLVGISCRTPKKENLLIQCIECHILMSLTLG